MQMVDTTHEQHLVVFEGNKNMARMVAIPRMSNSKIYDLE